MDLTVYVERREQRLVIGHLETEGGKLVSFRYDPSWLGRSGAKPLSFSLPLTGVTYGARMIRPYFEGLVPEGESALSLSRQLRVPATASGTILAALGRECAGAVSLIDEQHSAGEQPRYVLLGNDELLRLAESGEREAERLAIDSRLCLSGAQPKTGLYLDLSSGRRRWYLPKDGAPSTHIVKPESNRFDYLVENEFYCLQLARACGLAVPEAFMLNYSRPLLVVRRYDRIDAFLPYTYSGLSAPARLHQEDCCQALGVPSSEKYESGEVSNLARIADLIRDLSTDPVADSAAFVRTVAFNILIGNCDAHLKNFSLVRSKDWLQIRLAPVYDLVSTAVYEQLGSRLAMRIGEARHLDEVNRNSFVSAARDMELSLDLVKSILDDLCERVGGQYRKFGADNPVVDSIKSGIARRLGRLGSGRIWNSLSTSPRS